MKKVRALLSAAGLVFGILPLVSIILWTFIPRWPLAEALPSSLSLRAWHLLRSTDFAGLAYSVGNSVLIALVSSVLAIIASRALIRCRDGIAVFFEGIFFFPALVPVLCVVLAVHQWSVGFFGGFLGVPMFMLYLFFSFPYAFRVIYSAYRSDIRAVRETAFSLGAGSAQVLFLVELPLLMPYLTAAFVFAYSVAYGQYLIEAFFLTDTSLSFSIRMAELLQGADRSASAVYTFFYTLFGLAALVLPNILSAVSGGFRRRTQTQWRVKAWQEFVFRP